MLNAFYMDSTAREVRYSVECFCHFCFAAAKLEAGVRHQDSSRLLADRSSHNVLGLSIVCHDSRDVTSSPADEAHIPNLWQRNL